MYINAPPPYRCTFLPRKLIPLFGEERVGVCACACVHARMIWVGGCSVIITTKEIKSASGKASSVVRELEEIPLRGGHPCTVLFLCQ